MSLVGLARAGVVVATFLAGGAVHAEAPETLRGNMVQIESFDDSNVRIDCGVGILVRSDLILTAQHVLRPDLIDPSRKAVRYAITTTTSRGAIQIQPGASGAELIELPTQSSHLDVAFLRLGTNEVVGADDVVQMIGRIGEHEIGGATSQAVMLSYHVGTCHATSESEGTGLREHPTNLQPAILAPTGRHVSSNRMKLAPRLLDSYSGAPVVSTTFGAVVGVYTDGDAGSSAFGYAVSFDEPAIAELFSSVLGNSPRPLSRSYRRWYPRTNSSAAVMGQTVPSFKLSDRWEVSPVVAFAWELTASPAERPERSLAIRLAPLALVGGYRRRYLAPFGNTVLEMRSSLYGGGALELGVEWRHRRLQRVSPAVSGNGRVGFGKDGTGVFWLYAAVVRAELELSSGTWGVSIEAAASFGVQPGMQRRYTGLMSQAEASGRLPEFLLGLGPKVSF